MGVLRTAKGLIIKEKITKYLKPRFDIFYVEQEPPGVLFEYPAIKYAIKLAIEMNEPILYIHTKGAADPFHMWYQTPVKKLWEQEFGTDKVLENYKKVCCDEPTIICPIAGTGNQTWWNGFIMNPAAANLLTKTFHFDRNRYYYEYDMCNVQGMRVISSAVEGNHSEDDTNRLLKIITKDLPDIDY